MYFIFLVLLSVLPIFVGIAIIILFEKSTLSKAIFIFLTMVTFWQLDVAFLYSHTIFSESTILVIFKLFRFGTIMVTPAFLFIGYVVVHSLSKELQEKWFKIVNYKSIIFTFITSLIVYIIGWTNGGIKKLDLIKMDESTFYYPIYGNLNWIVYLNVFIFLGCMVICLLISLDVEDPTIRSFLVWFTVFAAIGYVIGTLNFVKAARLYPSSIGLLIYTASILIISSKTHLKIVNNMNNKLREQKNFLLQVINLNPNYIYAKNEQGHFTLMNSSYANLVGADLAKVLPEYVDETISGEELKQLSVPNAIQGKVFIREEQLENIDGKEVWVQTVKVPIELESGSTLLAVSTDITERKKFEDTIKYQANHDALTGLPNRRMFNDDLMNMLKYAKRTNSRMSVMLLDLDRFKYINDTLGHDIGDLVLQEVSSRFEELKKHNRNVKFYRLGGDEFIVLMPCENSNQAEDFAEKVLTVFDEIFIIAGNESYISPSIGISMFPEDGQDANTLIKHADTAMYYVKANGKGNYRLFDEMIQQNFNEKVNLEKHIRHALLNNEFELYYQPIVNIASNEIKAVEALLRWSNEELGNVSPEIFIPLAEEIGLISEIGEWVMEQAFQQQRKWYKEIGMNLKVSVNVSVCQLQNANFIEQIEKLIQNTGISTNNIALEITESIAMYEETTIEKLNLLKNLGIRLSMDDFGTGYSSLSYLNKYPLDTIKIDKSFIIQMLNDQESKAIVRTIIAIAKQLDLNIIAEGVEGIEEYRTLAKMGCDDIQGYFISRPLPADKLTEFLQQKSTFSNK